MVGMPSSISDFVMGFHEERTEEPFPHPIIGAYQPIHEADREAAQSA